MDSCEFDLVATGAVLGLVASIRRWNFYLALISLDCEFQRGAQQLINGAGLGSLECCDLGSRLCCLFRCLQADNGGFFERGFLVRHGGNMHRARQLI